MLLKQVSGLDGAIERRSVGNLKGTVIDKHAVFDHSRWPELHELAIRTQQARARFIKSKRNMANEYRSLDDWRCISVQAEPHRVHRRQSLAWNSVSAEWNRRLDRVRKPTLLNAVLVDVALNSFQLLSPVSCGIGQIFMSVGRPAPELIRIRHVRSWERSQRGNNMEKNEGANCPRPPPILADEAPGGSACQYEHEDEDQQDVTHADVQVRSHGHTEVERRRNGKEQDLSPALQPPSCNRIDDQRQEHQGAQSRLDHERYREIEPHAVCVNLPKDKARPDICNRAHIGESVEPRFRQQLPMRHQRNGLAFHPT